jgi:outer membrane protein assembly factor BamB
MQLRSRAAWNRRPHAAQCGVIDRNQYPRSARLLVAAIGLGFAVSGSGADWPRLLGPNDNCTTPEAGLLKTLPPSGPHILWETEKGSGFGGPAIVAERLVFFHRVGEQEIVECRDAGTGATRWVHAYDASYTPRYGGSTGPRTSPVIAGDRVFTFGISGQLHAVDLASGKVLWRRDCATDFAMKPNFFGFGSTPLVAGNLLVVQVGGTFEGEAVNAVGLDVATGKTVWVAKHEWGASYASPVPATIHGRSCILLFAGGQSRPPTGGLLVVDAKDGKVLSAIPHRADIAESVNASSPIVAAPNRVVVSEAYTAGALCAEIDPKFQARAAWKAENFGTYWMTPITREECLFGFAGMSERLAELVCHEAASGKELWRSDLGGAFGRASLLQTADGVLCLGEFGDLAWLDLSRKGVKILSRAKLFDAPETWTLPAIANGLLYVSQNESGRGGTKSRLICYDFRAP